MKAKTTCMKAFIAVLLLLVLQIQSQACSTPKIPAYLGKGYDIVIGNPLSNTVDPGFRYQVIVFDYNTGQKTEDNNFLVPDSISYQKSQSCSFRSDVNQYRGTQSYQDQLKTKVTISGGYEGPAVKAAFSASFGYKSVESKTQGQQTIIYQVLAECQSYKLALDKYKAYKVSQSFFAAVEDSYKLNNWDSFIGQYGTHYTTQVLFGGRAIQDSEFTRSSVSELKSKDIDIAASIKGGYAGFSAQVSTQNTISNTQKQQIQSSRKKVSQYYIGGQPPQSGKAVDWQLKVNQQPMPINYKISPLSDLFSAITNKTPDWVIAVRQSFFRGIQRYCNGKCKMPTPDKPLPTKKVAFFASTSSLYGGNGGGDFYFNQNAQGWQVTKVMVRHARYIDGIQIQVSNPKGQTSTSAYFGGFGGNAQDYVILPQREYISQIEVRSGGYVDGLVFFKNNGGQSPRFGSTGGSSYMVIVPADYKWTGIIGKSARYLDKIGFVFTKYVVSYSHHHNHLTKYDGPKEQ